MLLAMQSSFFQPAFSSATLEIRILEPAWHEGVSPFLDPGIPAARDLKVENNGAVPAFVRMRINNPSFIPEGSNNPRPAFIFEALPETSTPNSSNPHWFDGGDGWRYYSDALEPNSITAPLFCSIELDEGYPVKLYVQLERIAFYAQAIQASIPGESPKNAFNP
ncbi:MAG: hypothetical protein LBU32_14215 [Clostridiales bacterium]|nr:hypothetical protein [Clostridiales bacterium]